MSDEILRYDLMVENALRGVVRAALQEATTEGLPGEHHFYITFLTEHEGVQIPDRLKDRYPEEMTIVLQHRFWDLEVGEDKFSVTLTFNEIPENLIIPYEAVTAFADPSVRFGLQFGNAIESDEEIEMNNPLDEDMPQQAPVQDEQGQAAQSDEPGESAGEKVVTLDQFRKKN
ncbi:SspB family protein [Fodinicurvata halophila]|uniref:SspB family protein n=1 Tax=Fodinicurvata halophila TaxID=1419723 RepID=A0ABV8UFP6_9PROT